MTPVIEPTRAAANKPAAMHSMPAPTTTRGPRRSDSMPPKAPSTKYSSPESPNTSETSARCAANSTTNGSKKAANEYATPKITASTTKVAHTTTQP